ncbi:Na+/H+ antiporter NhaC family protein [Borreliella sinica]|uniref:Na+/H+ antiporter NhaC family protein n=1 Tax=Borreliella sinica TaxID=87162 RepID=UPI002A24E09C|nr:Na+/H+ antiporter NhaC family protein [Borreliella sinica]WPM06288.1 Na+/H+ antiporter NhaC family protein [Borreliella sinica]
MKRETDIVPNFWGLTPFFLFIGIYIGTGLVLYFNGVERAFYQMPPIFAMFIAIVLSFIFFRGSFLAKMNKFIEGCAQQDVIFISLIFMLSGAFSAVCKEIGSVEAVVNIGLKYVPLNLLVCGIFLITLFLSFSTGSFMGTVVAVAPIALELADKVNISLPLVAGAILSAGAFGDNMSLISDTPIISSHTQKVNVVDVFKNGAFYTFPAAILAGIVFAFLGSYYSKSNGYIIEAIDVNFFKIVPYIFVMVVAISGFNVFLALFLGIFVASAIGIYYSDITFLSLAKKINEGFLGLGEMFILVVFTGGISYMAIKYGGFDWLLLKLQKMSKSKRTSEFVIVFLVGILTVFLANNGLAILMSGSVVKSITKKNNLNSKRIAALLCMSSCFFLSILPHSMHVIALVDFTKGKLSPFDFFPFLIYQGFLLLLIALSIIGLDIRLIFNKYLRR